MTVTTTYAPVTATGDGSTVAFSFPYLVYQSSHLSITIDGASTSAWTAATYGEAAGVTVTFDTAPTNGAAIIIRRIVPYTQNTDLENFDGNPADVTEKQFDLLAMADQQIASDGNRAILSPVGTSLTSNEIAGTIDGTTRVLTITTAGPASSTLSTLSSSIDTTLTSLATDDILQWGGASWVNTQLPAPEYSDSTFRIQDNADATKEIAFEASGITTGTTRTVTVPDASGTLLYVGDVLDEDNMATDSAVYPPSQQSTKVYVDTEVATLPFQSEFISAEQTITFNSLLTVAHELGVKPKILQVVRICKTAEDGWAVGDEIIMQSADFGGTDYYGSTIGSDATNVYITTGANITGHIKSTGAGALTVAANWRYIVRAWA